MNGAVKMVRRLSALGLCGALAMYSVQTVAGGQSFEDAFADVVCNNGWVACLVDGDELTVDSVQDSRGILHNPSSRVSFFDFAPLPGHSPFDMVEDYPEVVAEVEPVVEEPEPVKSVVKKPKAESCGQGGTSNA